MEIPVHSVLTFTTDKGVLVCCDWHNPIGEQRGVNLVVVQLDVDHW